MERTTSITAAVAAAAARRPASHGSPSSSTSFAGEAAKSGAPHEFLQLSATRRGRRGGGGGQMCRLANGERETGAMNIMFRFPLLFKGELEVGVARLFT